MRRRAFAASLGVAVAAGAFAVGASSASAAALGDPPPNCGGEIQTDCLLQSWLGTFSISPTVVRENGRITGTVTVLVPEISKVFGRTRRTATTTWSWPAPFECDGSITTCTAKVGGPTNGYVTASLRISNNLAGHGTSQGVYAVLERESAIAGRVVDDDKTPVAGVRIVARGKVNRRATTDGSGSYRIVVPKDKLGRYTVRATARGAEFKPEKREVTVRRNRSVRANFKHAKCTADRRGSERLRRSSNGTLSASVATAGGCLTQGLELRWADPPGDLPVVEQFVWKMQFHCYDRRGRKSVRDARYLATQEDRIGGAVARTRDTGELFFLHTADSWAGARHRPSFMNRIAATIGGGVTDDLSRAVLDINFIPGPSAPLWNARRCDGIHASSVVLR